MFQVAEKRQLPNSYNYILPKQKINLGVKLGKYVDLPKTITPLVIIDNTTEAVKRIPDKSISVIVTSPPYWNLKDYYNKNQIGAEKKPEEYVKKLLFIFNSFLRILKDDGAFFLNIGDSYANQSLQMIPQRIAIGMQEQGWLIRNQIIWHKPNAMPSPVKNRFSNSYEFIYFFSKNDWEKQIYFDLDSVRIPHKTTQKEQAPKLNYNGKFVGETKNLGQSPGARISINGHKYTTKRKIKISKTELVGYLNQCLKDNHLVKSDLIDMLGYNEYNYKVSHWFRLDAGFSYPSKDDWIALKKVLKFDDKYDKELTTEYKEIQSVKHHPKGKNPSDLFVSNTAKSNDNHFAVFPESIPELAIKACCPKDGIVLDPFAGSGTTGVVAHKLNKKSILIDIQKNFIPIMKKKIEFLKRVTQ